MTATRLTLAYFAVQTSLVGAGFVLRQDWLFGLLAAVNLLAGPLALAGFVLGRARRAGGGPR